MSSKVEISKELFENIRHVLGKNVRTIFVYLVRLETKGLKPDNKILVFTTCRLFIMPVKIPSKVEFNFHYLEIKAIESKSTNFFGIEIGDKLFNFYANDEASDQVDRMILQLTVLMRNLFPGIPLQHIVKRVEVVPPSRLQNLFERHKSQEIKEPGPCGGFSLQYACMCDFHGLPYRDEVAWDVDTIYLSHDTRELCVQDFDHLDPKDLIPIISALVYNKWFTKLKISNIRLTSEAAEQIHRVLRKSLSIEELRLDNMGLRWDYVQKLSQALASNANSAIHTLDLSNNLIEDKGVLHLVSALINLPRGLVHLNLAKAGLSSKGVNTLANGLSVNKFMSSSLTYLNLADNVMKEEVNKLYSFLAQPNTITHLDLSGTDVALDMLFGALLRGCSQKLSHINLSRNSFSHKKPRDVTVPTSFKQFFSTSIGLKYLNLSATKLPTDALKSMLLGLTFNEVVKDVELDLSSNNMGSAGAHDLEMCIGNVKALATLDISDNGLETELASVILAIGRNKSLKKLAIGKNFANIKNKHMVTIMDAFVQIIQDDESVIEHLSLADSKLKTDIYAVINALGSNQSLVSVDISGNQIGDPGARLLAKALQINTRLKALFYDRNNISTSGFCDLAYGLQTNYSMRYMPVPIFDVCLAMKTNPERTDAALKRIENLLHRNVSPKKFSNSQAFRLQQGFLLSSTQQMVDRLVVQTQDFVRTMNHSVMEGADEWVLDAESYIKDANKSKQLLTRLHEVVLQREESGNPIEEKLLHLSEELQLTAQSYIQSCVDSMLKCAEDQCPRILNEKLQTDLKTSSRLKSKLPPMFVRQNLVELAGTDITNKINELNLVVASHISDRIVDEVIESLSKSQKALLTLERNMQNSTPDSQLRRPRLGSDLKEDVFSEKDDYLQDTFRSKRKSVQTRKLRPQSVVDIPDELIADGPIDVGMRNSKSVSMLTSPEENDDKASAPQRLQHLGKDRPKRLKTKAPTRTNLRAETTTSTTEEDHNLNEGLDRFFHKSEAINTAVSLPNDDKRRSIVPKTDKSKEKHEVKKNVKGSESEKEKKGGRLVQGLSNMFSRRTSDRSSKHKLSSDESLDKSKNESEPMSLPIITKEAEQKVLPSVDETTLRQPVAIPKIGVGGNVLAEMKARQEKRLSLHREQPEIPEKEQKLTTPKTQPTTPVLGNEKNQSNGFGNRLSLSPADRRSRMELPGEQLPSMKTTTSTPRLYTSPSAETTSDINSNELDDGLNSVVKRGLPPKPRPPPIAPKPRPRSMISPDYRKSGDFSPVSDVSSLDGSAGTTPERGDLQEDSIDSGLMGSRDSLSPRELTPDPELTPDLESGKRKATSLPRTATPDMVMESSSRGRSLSYKEILNSSFPDDIPQGSQHSISPNPDSAPAAQNRHPNESSDYIESEIQVDDVVNV